MISSAEIPGLRAPTLVVLGLLAGLAGAQEESKVVVGPANIDIADGADALLAGNAEEGVARTLRGLEHAESRFERQTAWSNLCAGYILLDKPETALEYCGKVIAESDTHWRAYCNRAVAYVMLMRYDDAEQDLQRAEAIRPDSYAVHEVRALLRDVVDPVAPSVTIDDRRMGSDADVEE